MDWWARLGFEGKYPTGDLPGLPFFLAAYLLGSIPFGYLIARLKGVDIRAKGSGNIGATNVSRVLGRPLGVLVFLLDFAKGAVPVLVAQEAGLNRPGVSLTGLAAFLGHVYPIYLRFRGGKGVATGMGVIWTLVPVPAAIGSAVWATALLAFRYVSLASILAFVALLASRLLLTPHPLTSGQLAPTLFCLTLTAMVIYRHSSNLARLSRGEEPRIDEKPAMLTISRTVHVLALGLWFGSAVFFTFSAQTIFESFKDVVHNAPSDRTAGQPLLPPGAPEAAKKDLASALAGSAVGPLFPPYFLLQGVCGLLAVITALGFARRYPRRSVDRWRVIVLAAAWLTVLVGWPISQKVSALRIERFATDPAVAEAARAAFGGWHVVSLLLSLVTTLLVTAGMALAAKLPAAPAEVTVPEPSEGRAGGSPVP